jgi:hypothetical protein
VPPLSFESWVFLASVAGAGVIGSLYGFACILERELSKIRLARRAKEVMEAHQRKLDAIARGEAEASLNGEELVLPIGDLLRR